MALEMRRSPWAGPGRSRLQKYSSAEDIVMVPYLVAIKLSGSKCANSAGRSKGFTT